MTQTFGGQSSSREFAQINAFIQDGRFNGQRLDLKNLENGDVMDAKTTDEMTNEKDAEILEIEPHVLPRPLLPASREKAAVAELGNSG